MLIANKFYIAFDVFKISNSQENINMKIMTFLLYFEIRTNCKQKQFKEITRRQSTRQHQQQETIFHHFNSKYIKINK